MVIQFNICKILSKKISFKGINLFVQFLCVFGIKFVFSMYYFLYGM